MTTNKFRKHCQSKQQPLRGGDTQKYLGSEENPLWGDLTFHGGTYG